MQADLQQLVEQARSGEEGPFQNLVAALRADPTALAEAVRSAEELLRRAVAVAARDQSDAPWREAVSILARDSEATVRAALAQSAAAGAAWATDDLVRGMLLDEDARVRYQAGRAARGRAALEPTLLLQLQQDRDWRVRQVAAQSLAGATPRAALPVLLQSLAQDEDRDVAQACAESAEGMLTALGSYPADAERPRLALLEEAQRRTIALGAARFPRLAAWLEQRVTHDADPERLAGFGALLTAEAEAGRLPHGYGVSALCDAVYAVLTGPAPRAAVLMGPPGSGKTAVVHELTHRLRSDPTGPWHVIRVSPAELLAGTVYLGEWQTRLRDLVRAARHPRRVVIYVPNLGELSHAGRSMQSDSSLATALAPHIEAGEVTILGESTPEAFRSGLGSIGSLRRLFHAVEVREAGASQTRAVLQDVSGESRAEVPAAVLDRLLDLADYYVPGTAQPGRAVGLLRRVLADAAGRTGPITERDVLATLSASTGIPDDVLDDEAPIDRGRVRTFFENRVMGQPEAVEAIVDLVALVKAGLTDPGKPFGVLLFVGPTGVGKTELARALAEYLFGDSGRLLRLDMSEFSAYEAHERLLGWDGRPGLLTGPVREHPFSVVLLDEIEKAHPNVFDLCLQVFDAGRLTDMQGRTTDFRRTIIILTSNVGAETPGEGPFGFRGTGETPTADNTAATLRELGRWFRPEFLNRLDRVVTFHPLAEETAERIARREVVRVLERSGIARRRLSVDVDPAVLALLLREGYSPAFGARPLKRTVERRVLLPVAWAIAGGKAPAGSLLRLVARGGQVEVEVTPADQSDSWFKKETPSAAPDSGRVAALSDRVAAIRASAAELGERKSELVARAAAPSFWDDRDAARGVLDEIYRLDGILSSLDALEKAVRQEMERFGKRPASDADRVRRRLEALEGRAEQVAFLVGCRAARDLGDAFVVLTLVSSHGSGLEAVGKLSGMYTGLANRRGFETEVLDDRQGGHPHEDTITLLVSGAGAYALLAREAGLHQVARGHPSGRHDRRRPSERDVVRVEVLHVPAGDGVLGKDTVRVEARPLEGVRGRLLARPRLEVQLLHVPSMTAVRAWTDGPKARAIERLRPLLAARVEVATASEPTPASLVRRYVLGPAPFVRDLRLNRTTGRLDQVLKGHLDPFLVLPGAGAG